MYPASDWSICSGPLISARGRSHYRIGLDRAIRITSVRTRREDRSSISSFPLADLGGQTDEANSSLCSSSHAVPLFVPEDGSFVPARTSSKASRAGAVKAGRRAVLTSRTAIARPRLDGAEHGARIKRVGRPHHQSSSFRSHAPWREPPRRCERACWRERSPARCDAIASCEPRSRI